MILLAEMLILENAAMVSALEKICVLVISALLLLVLVKPINVKHHQMVTGVV
jgi:hypothetical protein